MAIRKTIISLIDFFHFPFLKFIPSVTFRYLFCGVSTILVDWIVFYVGYNFLFTHPFPIGFNFVSSLIGNISIQDISVQTQALLAAFVAGFVWGFALNKYVVFTASPLRGRVQLFRYSVIVATCIVLNYLLMNFFISNVGIYPFPARMITSLLVAVYSYLVQRSFTFKVNAKEA